MKKSYLFGSVALSLVAGVVYAAELAPRAAVVIAPSELTTELKPVVHMTAAYIDGATNLDPVSGVGEATVLNQVGDWIDYVRTTGTGRYEIRIKNNIFSSDPICTVTVRVSNARIAVISPSTNTSQISVVTMSGLGGVLDTSFYISCIGHK